MVIEIVPAYNRIGEVRELLTEYTTWLGLDLGFQHFDEEFATLPGKYAPPLGRLLLAVKGQDAAGCVALRRHSTDTAEMKRLFVRPACRSLGIGRLLVETASREAREAGYSRIILDTHASMENSVALYRDIGFTDIPPFYHNPHPGVLYLGMDL